jgi:hypothetical protein
MFTKITGTTRRMGRWALAIQAMLVLATLLVSLAPSPGKAALYVPLVPASPVQGIAWAKRNGGYLLGRGALPGSLVIQPSSPDFQPLAGVLSAAAEGALLLSAPGPLCGRDRNSANIVDR